jgi:hypothetical protein
MDIDTRISDIKLSWCDAAFEVLKNENRPLGSTEIAERIMSRRLVKSKSKTPAVTVHVCILGDMDRRGPKSRFMKFGNKFGLSEWSGRSDFDPNPNKTQTNTQIHYWERYGFKEISDKQLVSLVRNEIQEIRSFLKGQNDSDISQEKLCFWVWYSYQLGLYWEGSLVFKKINPMMLAPPLFQTVKKIGIACENRRE